MKLLNEETTDKAKTFFQDNRNDYRFYVSVKESYLLILFKPFITTSYS